ncbi:MAG: crotonase/enoyl-CoA hydratase family protein, partial [Deferrisomatales bacterium]
DALGGGFEAAISFNVVLAEADARFGLPEVLFNLFPGMGAYSLLARRLGPDRAERIILSGDLYTAAQMHEMGVVDGVVPRGEGEQAVRAFIERHRKRRNAHLALFRVRGRYRGLAYDELVDIGEIWVEAALGLEPKDLRLMRRLVGAQNRRNGAGDEALGDSLGTA